MTRRIEPELLDQLPPDDPGAIGSRADLRRLNAWMGHTSIAVRALRQSLGGEVPRRILDLGAGDGSFFLGVASRLAKDWPGTTAVLLDRQEIVQPQIRHAFEELGWHPEIRKADVLEWLRQPPVEPFDLVFANLFLHQFLAAPLAELLAAVAQRAQALVAVEPHRSAWSLMSSRLVWLIGCNRVTQHDAPVSVRAGFAANELSRLWPANGTWSLEERSAGCFSHLFIARKNAHPNDARKDLK